MKEDSRQHAWEVIFSLLLLLYITDQRKKKQCLHCVWCDTRLSAVLERLLSSQRKVSLPVALLALCHGIMLPRESRPPPPPPQPRLSGCHTGEAAGENIWAQGEEEGATIAICSSQEQATLFSPAQVCTHMDVFKLKPEWKTTFTSALLKNEKVSLTRTNGV